MNRAQLLEQMHSGRQRLEATLARVRDDQMLTPSLPGNWSVKDLLAHIGWWEQWIVNTYDTLLRGEIPYSPHLDEMAVDDLNAQLFAEYHDRPLAEVHREEKDAYQKLLSLAENAAEEDLFHPHRFAWMEGHPFVEWIINNTYEHYDEHLRDLLRWLG